MTGAETKGGEWTERAAEEREMMIVGDVVKDWQRFGDNRKTIVFGATIKHCEELCRQFMEAGIMSAIFTSETTAKEREELLKEYRKPDSMIRVLISVEALAKGFDVPDVGCICDARPLRKSLSTAIQMWGRGLRSSPDTGKQDCHLLDFSGNIIRFFEDFNDIYFNGLAKLDDGDKLDKKVRDKEEFEPKGCPRCGYKPFHKRCMACGFEKIAKTMTEVVAGNMEEIFIGEGKDKKKLANNAEHLWDQVCTYARHHSAPDKQSKRAWHLFKDITGAETLWRFSTSKLVEITPNVINKIKNLNIRYSRSKK
jgi:superfamily II DNA or RNA helicase